MPDPTSYAKAMAAAFAVGAACALAIGRAGRPARAASANLACVAGVAAGLWAGYFVLPLHPIWPPANGLGRFLWIVLPAAVGIEWIAGLERSPRWCAGLLRLGLAASIGRILLRGSVYLVGPKSEWTALQAAVVLALCGGLLAVAWALLLLLARRSPGVSIPLALAEAGLCAGFVVVLAGYVTGGAAALPLAAALVGVSAASRWTGQSPEMQGTIGLGIVGLFGLLFIGRFFGGLSTATALAVFLAPLSCWATEVPVLRGRKPWLVAMLRLAIVAVPLMSVCIVVLMQIIQNTKGSP